MSSDLMRDANLAQKREREDHTQDAAYHIEDDRVIIACADCILAAGKIDADYPRTRQKNRRENTMNCAQLKTDKSTVTEVFIAFAKSFDRQFVKMDTSRSSCLTKGRSMEGWNDMLGQNVLTIS